MACLLLQVKDDKAKWCSQRGLSLRALKKAADIYNQLAGHLQALGLGLQLDASDLVGAQDEGQDLRRALTAGLFMNAAMRQADGGFPAFFSSGVRACLVFFATSEEAAGSLLAFPQSSVRAVTNVRSWSNR